MRMKTIYPFYGTIKRNTAIVQDNGDTTENSSEIYKGEMDINMNTPDSGNVAQISEYTVNIPLTKDENDDYIIPKKNDIITATMLGYEIVLIIRNCTVSMVGNITIYATKGVWK